MTTKSITANAVTKIVSFAVGAIVLCSFAFPTLANDKKFNDLLDRHWQAQLAQSPTFATSLGVRDYDDQLDDQSLEAFDAAVANSARFLQELQKIKRSSLNKQNQLNYDLLSLDLSNDIERARHGGKYLIMNNRSGPHLDLTSMPNRLPFFTLADYQSYVTRLGKMADYMSQSTRRIRAGLEAGWVQPCAPMQGFETSIQTHIVEDINDSTFLKPLRLSPM